jgi:hypothetical protein
MHRNAACVFIGLCLLLLIARPINATAQVRSTEPKLTLPADARPFQFSAIARDCIDFKTIKRGKGPDDYSDCAVTASGDIGSVDGKTYLYAIYCVIPSRSSEDGKCGDRSFTAFYHQARALAVFVRDSSAENVTLLIERVDPDLGLYYYETPQIIRTAAGNILHIPIVVDGTGHGNESEYYLWENQEWRLLDAASWLDDLRKQLPPDLAIWKGVWPDLKTMQVVAGLYRSNDANCCPTGGVVRAKLAIRSGQFVIESIAVEPAKPAQ